MDAGSVVMFYTFNRDLIMNKNMTKKGYILYKKWEMEDKQLFRRFSDNGCLDVIRALAELLSGNRDQNTYITF